MATQALATPEQDQSSEQKVQQFRALFADGT